MSEKPIRRVRCAALAVALGCVGMLALPASAGDAPVMSQDLVLQKGWNAFTLKVTPSESAETLFRTWPLAKAGEYDGDVANATAQYSAYRSSDGATAEAWRTYVPGNPDLTTLTSLSANKTYLVRLTNGFSTVVWGVPAATRNALHATSSNVLCFAQVSLQSATNAVRLVDYFDGFDVGKWTAYEIYGDKDSPQMRIVQASETFDIRTEVSAGKTLAIECARTSDWSGPLYVSPVDGLDFGAEAVRTALSVRNDTTTNRTFRLTLERAHTNATGYLTFVTNYWLREVAAVGSNAAWRAFSMQAPFERDLAPGATVEFELALDRTKWSHLPADTPVGGLLAVDELGSTRFRTTVPIQARVGGLASLTNGWPNGIWILDASLDAVSYVKSKVSVTEPIAARGKMPVRLILHYVAGDAQQAAGRLSLLPCVQNGRVRITSAFVPIVSSSIGANENAGKDVPYAFGDKATFTWRVGADSAYNPFYHAQHPDHDGLTSDYSAYLPTGDTRENYLNDAKPELFSIDNTVELTWSTVSGQSWSPEECVSGTLLWRFGNLRRQGEELQASGPFTMTRVSAFNPFAAGEEK